jgi:hypothetical protein
MPNRIQLRRGTAIDWFNANPVLAEGEICVELDSGMFKIGDGVLHWRDLLYATGPQGTTGTSASITLGTVTISTSTTTIVNVGDTQNAIFDFTLQAGVKGDTGTQINKLIDIHSTGLTNGSLLVYNGTSLNWNTETDLPFSSNIDAGEF